MTFKPFVLLLVLSSLGCSSSNDDSAPDVLPDGSDTNGGAYFQEPDVNGSSDLARLSYPLVRDLSRELVTGAYLDLYFDTDSAIGELLVQGIGGQDSFQNGEIPPDEVQAPFACPEGGTVRVSYTDRNGPFATYTALFADCGLENHTLSGTLTRDADPGVIGGGGYDNVTVDFENLTIDASATGVLKISGSATRNSTYSSAEMLPPGERGSCALDESNKSFFESSSVQSATLERSIMAGSITINDSSYERDERRTYDATSDEIDCPLFREANEEGNAVVTFVGYGASTLTGQATITTRVASGIEAGAPIHTGTQTSELPDGSSVTITAVSDLDCTAQVDILADAAAISFVDNYCFVVKDF